MPRPHPTRRVRSAFVALGASHHVRYVLFGAVDPAGRGIALTLRLFETAHGTEAWEQTYSTPLIGMLALESEIARTVAAHTRAGGGSEGTAGPDLVGPDPTSSPAAYLMYLRGTAELPDLERSDAEDAMEEYSRAFRLDPAFAAAWSGFALAAVTRLEREGGRLASANAGILARAVDASNRAMRLAPGSVDTWIARGAALELQMPRERTDALAAYRRAIAIEPWNGEARRRYGRALIEAGTVDDGIGQMRLALREGPGDPETLNALAEAHLMQRAYHDACHAVDGAIDSDPRNAAAYVLRAYVRLHLKDIRNAYGDAETGVRLGAWLTGGVAAIMADAAARDTTSARQRLAALVSQMPGAVDRPTVWQSHYIAKAYATLGQTDAALAILDRAQPRGADLWSALRDPDFDRIRDRPEFGRLLSTSQTVAAATP